MDPLPHSLNWPIFPLQRNVPQMRIRFDRFEAPDVPERPQTRTGPIHRYSTLTLKHSPLVAQI